MKYSKLHYYIAFTLLRGIGHFRMKTIIDSGVLPKDFFTKSLSELHQQTGISKQVLQKSDRKDALEKSVKHVREIERLKLKWVCIEDENYPSKLKSCPDAPPILFIKGDTSFRAPKYVAIVGTRDATPYGKRICEELIASFKDKNIVVVSGMAHGIDAIVHRFCLEMGVPTIAVLGNGLDRVYPAIHRELARKIENSVCLISEFLPGTMPDKENFPKRNRIVAGICDAVIVVESKKRGGSLITASLANEYNRDVFAYPGSVFQETSQGCNKIIKEQKAHLIQNSSDFFDIMGWKTQTKKHFVQRQLFNSLSKTQEKIIRLLSKKDTPFDILVMKTKIPVSKMNQELFDLEMNGVISALPGRVYRLI